LSSLFVARICERRAGVCLRRKTKRNAQRDEQSRERCAEGLSFVHTCAKLRNV
jgi:hypothetical protein